MNYKIINKNKFGGFNLSSYCGEGMVCVTGANDDMDWGLIEIYTGGIKLSKYIGDTRMDLTSVSSMLKIIGVDIL